MEVHHAYIGSRDDSFASVTSFLKNTGLSIENAHFHYFTFLRLGADEARAVCEKAIYKSNATEIYAISAGAITPQAQNVLLKTLEEPPENALFFLLVPAPRRLLPTLLSRTQLLPSKETSVAPEIKEFLDSPFEARTKLFAHLIAKDEDRDIGAITSFLDSLESALSSDSVKNKEALKAVFTAKKYAFDTGAMQKMLLEYVALAIPKIN